MDVCYLCKSSKKDDIQYGEFLRNENMAVHTFCLYLSSNLSQKGGDDEGFLGFLEADIEDEVRRVFYLKCFYCREPYANVGCCEVKCRHAFHFICGLENGAQNQFCNSYKSYCHRHIRKISPVRPSKDATCLICYDQLFGPKERFSSVNMIQAPCCRNGWFHKLCLLKFAKTSGYFFKCPLCNDAKIFRQKLPAKGIYIPNQDAAWELEPNAFAELLERPSECSASPCENKEGRKSTSTSNPLIFCSTCGSTAMHKHCLPSRGSRFHCSDCTIAMEDRDSGRDSLNSPANHRSNNDDEYGDIDVCNVSDHENLEIVQGLLPDNKPDCESESEIGSVDEEVTITCRRRCLTLYSDSDSDYSETLKENRNPSAQRNHSDSRNEVPKEQKRNKTKARNTASSTKEEVTHRRRSRILYTIEDEDVEIVHNDGSLKSNGTPRRQNDSDDDDEFECIRRSRPVRTQKDESNTKHQKSPRHQDKKAVRVILDDSDDSGNNETVCANMMRNGLSSTSSDEEYRIKTNRKRALHIESGNKREVGPGQIPNKQHRNTKKLTIISTDDDSDEELSSPPKNIKSSERDSAIAQATSDEESDEDDDPLENFTKLVEKQKKNSFVAQKTRHKSTCLENPRQEGNSRWSIISSNSNARKLSQTTERSKTLRFDCLPQNNCKASKELDTSCIAKRTRRKSVSCESGEQLPKGGSSNQAGNTAGTSCAAVRTRGRRKTVCSQTTIEKEKHKQRRCPVEKESDKSTSKETPGYEMSQIYEKEYQTDEDIDNFIVPDDCVEYAKETTEKNKGLSAFEISCIANRTRKRTCSKPQVIDEESSSSFESASSSSSSYYSASSNNPVISSQKSCTDLSSRFHTKWPKHNIDFAYLRRNLNHSSKLHNPKSYHPCYRHNSHANSHRRI